jgi:hypothetical protein
MRFGIGDVVHHHATNEEGRIVRVCTINQRAGYIVMTTLKSGKQIEALWFSRELQELKVRAPRYGGSNSLERT